MSEREAVLRAIAFGDDPDVRPADRLKALELLGAERPDRLSELSVEEIDRELDALLSRWPHHPEIGRRFPLLAAGLAEEAERRAREIADAGRIEAEIERRAEERAEERARDLYRSRAFEVVEAQESSSPAAEGVGEAPEPEEGAQSLSELMASARTCPPGVSADALGRQWPERRRRGVWPRGG